MAQIAPEEGHLKLTATAVQQHSDMFGMFGVSSPKEGSFNKSKSLRSVKAGLKGATTGVISMHRLRRKAALFMMGNRDVPPFMIEPNSMNKLAWDLGLITPLIAYLTLAMPFRMCFQNSAKGSMAIFEMCIDIVFIIDILVNFRSAYNDPNTGDTVYDSWKIAKHYVRTWFVIDVASGIPFGVLDLKAFDGNDSIKVLKQSSFLKTIKVLRFLKLSRLLKGTRIFRGMDEELVDRIQDFMAHGTTKTFLRMSRIIFTLCFICHVMACLWVLVGRTGAYQDKDNWLEAFFGFDPEDTEHGITVSRVYLTAFYYCFTTMTGVGYGDITPQNDSERGFAIVLEGIGGFTYAYIIGSLTSVVSMQDSNTQEVDSRIDAVSSYINNTAVPEDMGRRVRRYYRHFFASRCAMDEMAVLGDLSSSLRVEVSSYLVHHMRLEEVMIFQLVHPIHWASILPVLRPCAFNVDDVLTFQGEYSTDAYIILEGNLTVSSNNANMGHLIDHIEHHKVIDKGCSTPTEEKNSKLNDERRRASALSAAAAISGRTPKLSHMLALHPEHEALHHALQLCSFVKSEEDADLTESRRGSIDTLKKTAYSSMFNSIVDAIQPRKQFHLRVVTKGQMLGILGLLKVYGRNLETAKCIGPVECYAINNEAFFKIFEKNPEIIERLRERVTENHFQMMPHEHAPTKYGIPLFRHSPEDIEKREGVWLKNIMKKEREMASRVRRDAGIVLTPKDSVGSIHENWSASYMPEEPQEEDDKNKISTIDSLDKSIDIPVDPQKSEGDRKVNWVRAVSSETGETTKT